ncbi:MAG TPA: heme ABC exporter ATP-binding protein CcmA [Actinomycetota bacterium]|nr:heme ABC exporter ATP-binding protein CcmA [Actinomycetota bacterium]
MITIAGLTVTFGRTLALDRLDLELGEGVTGLFGQNGSGKSTLLRVLAGLLRPRAGSVSVEGTRIDIGDERFRSRVGYVGHTSGLYPHLTVGENLELFARLYGAAPERIEGLLKGLDIADRRTTPVADLSAGLKRRAAVARGLLHEPDLLLLDEPYANLDDGAAAALSEAVKAWVAPGRAAVIATHGAKKVKPFADATVVLQRGHIVSHRVRVPAEASADEVIA